MRWRSVRGGEKTEVGARCFAIVRHVRGEKTTKEIGEDELARLKKPEERSTTALDPTELAKLVDRSSKTRSPTNPPETRAGTEDDLAIPVEGTPPPGPLPATPSVPIVADASPQGRAHTASWSGPTKESAVIVSTPPEADPAPAPESAPLPIARTRSRGHVQRISTPSLGVMEVAAPIGHRALTKPPEINDARPSSAPRLDETPARMPRGSTRQATLDEVASMHSANKRSLKMALVLAAPCALLAVVYLLMR